MRTMCPKLAPSTCSTTEGTLCRHGQRDGERSSSGRSSHRETIRESVSTCPAPREPEETKCSCIVPNTDRHRLSGTMSEMGRWTTGPTTEGPAISPPERPPCLQSITTQDFGFIKENRRLRGIDNGRQKNVVRLRRGLTQIPDVMVNRLNNDGQVVNTHALQSAHSANFKYRKELGETAVEGTGVRASILRNAASARYMDLRPDAHQSHGSSQHGG